MYCKIIFPFLLAAISPCLCNLEIVAGKHIITTSPGHDENMTYNVTHRRFWGSMSCDHNCWWNDEGHRNWRAGGANQMSDRCSYSPGIGRCHCYGLPRCSGTCDGGHWITKGGKHGCSDCASCSTGYYVKTSCSTYQNTVCSQCSSCSSGYFISRGCSSSQNTACSKCSSCSSGYYISRSCSSNRNTGCSRCSTCSSGYYISRSCSTTQNTGCSRCSTCSSGYYISRSCSTNRNTGCSRCSTCSSGYYISRSCSTYQNTACSRCSTCPAGYYISTQCSSNRNTVCTRCQSCPVGWYISTPCSTYKNTVCSRVPTTSPTVTPTVLPTGTPTIAPTVLPTGTPTIVPTVSPTGSPTIAPTISPTGTPTIAPIAPAYFAIGGSIIVVITFLTFLMKLRAKKGRKRNIVINNLITAGVAVVYTEAGEHGLQDSEIPAQRESIEGNTECETGGEVTDSSLSM